LDELEEKGTEEYPICAWTVERREIRVVCAYAPEIALAACGVLNNYIRTCYACDGWRRWSIGVELLNGRAGSDVREHLVDEGVVDGVFEEGSIRRTGCAVVGIGDDALQCVPDQVEVLLYVLRVGTAELDYVGAALKDVVGR